MFKLPQTRKIRALCLPIPFPSQPIIRSLVLPRFSVLSFWVIQKQKMSPEKIELRNATDSENHSVISGQSSCSPSSSSSRTPSSRREFESVVSDDGVKGSPNYMKTTTSSVAKKSSSSSSNSQRSGDSSYIKPAKGLARLSSSRSRMKKSFKRRQDFSWSVDSVSDDSEGERGSGDKPVRTLGKVASLRIRRQAKSSVVKVTCSSAMKDSKPEGSHSNEAAAAAGMKVCPYSYCSMHGHHHNDQLPSMKRFVSMRRRLLKPQRKTSNSSEKGSQQSSHSKRLKRSDKKRQGDQTRKNVVVAEGTELGQNPCVEVEGHNQPQYRPRGIKDLVTSPSARGQNAEKENHHFADHKPEGGHLSTGNSMEKNTYMGLWGLIYQHMVSGIAPDGDDSQQPEEVHDVENASGMGERADAEVDSHQLDAIKLVQEAFDNILLEIPDPLSDNQSADSIDTASDQLGDNMHSSTSAAMKQVPQQKMKLEAETSNGSRGEKAEAKVGNESSRKRLNGWSNLKKIMLMKRFVKAMEKVKNFENNTHKPRDPSIDQEGEAAEKVNLLPRSIGQKKNTEEWMLDYALQKVISTMAPAQKRKVALIVQAFETVAPRGESDNHTASSTPRTPVQISRNISTQKGREQEEENTRFGILLRKVSIASKDSHEQDGDACTAEQHIHVPCPEPYVDELASETGVADLNPAVHDDADDLIRLETGSNEHIDPIGEEPVEPRCQTANGTHQEELILDDSVADDTSEEITNRIGDIQPPTAAESPVGKQEHVKLWYLIYNHMVSGTTQPLQENGEEEGDTPSGRNESRSQLEAIRLVEEAIDEIPLPETQDDVPASIKPSSTGCNKERSEEEPNSSKTEVRPSCEEDGKEKEEPKPPLRKSWSNLKKVILLKRFIKSLEKVNDSYLTSSARKVIIPKETQFLATEHEKEAEKVVQLRHQYAGGRRNGDEWMLDYALRQVVAQLTPVRRRKVELLVEAFETVTPIGS